MKIAPSFLSFFYFIFILSACSGDHQKNNPELWYRQPAAEWLEALPLGNGRLGAMVYGNPRNEIIQLNEESLWAGQPINNNNPKSRKNLEKIRQLLFRNQNKKALNLAKQSLLGTPPRIRSYQTLGNLLLNMQIDTTKITNYRRSLNLSTGLIKVSYKVGKHNYERTAFVSAPDNVLIVHLQTDAPKGLTFEAGLNREQDATTRVFSKNQLLMEGQITDETDSLRGPGGNHMRFAGLMQINPSGGELSTAKNRLKVKGAESAYILFTAETDYSLPKLGFDTSIDPVEQSQKLLTEAQKKPYEVLKQDHIADHQSMFDRVALKLSDVEQDTIPTDQRLKKVQQGADDPYLTHLYFQYGRYLLMGSSRSPGVLPANLQGIWNNEYTAPWNSDFHVNINQQMNYWPTEVTNLTETVLPMVRFFEKIRNPGSVTAKQMYGAGGWTMHHLTDPFGRTGLMDAIMYGTFPMGGPWVTFPVWRHFEFTQDTSYLKNQAWPMMKGSAEFVMDFLVEGPDSNLVTAPSYSPENTFILPESNAEMRLTYAPTIDIMIIRELFKNCEQAAKIVGGEDAFVSRMKKMKNRLPPIQIGADGTIQEWIKDYEEAEPGHRHFSHLLGLHPGSQIGPNNPELFEAARKTIERRLTYGGGHTGWSQAWIVNFYARLLDGENAHKHLHGLLARSTLSNLFDSYPPFQIDGNFGGTAGIAEMLLQSHNGRLRILPALPPAWKQGHVTGLKARGNFEIDIYWQEHELEKLVIRSGSGLPCELVYEEQSANLETTPGEILTLDSTLKKL